MVHSARTGGCVSAREEAEGKRVRVERNEELFLISGMCTMKRLSPFPASARRSVFHTHSQILMAIDLVNVFKPRGVEGRPYFP